MDDNRFYYIMIGAFYYDPDDAQFGTYSIESSVSTKQEGNGALGIAVLYHKSADAKSNGGLGYWEYSLPNNPEQFLSIPEKIGWPKNEAIPEVFLRVIYYILYYYYALFYNC